MASLEGTYEAACKAKTIDGAVLLAKDVTGSFDYAKALGIRTTIDGVEKPLELDSCVERGLITLTEDVARVLPHLGVVSIITQGQSGDYVLKKKEGPITLEQLLTHSSGIVYEYYDPLLLQWRKSRGEHVGFGSTVDQRFGYPLKFQPGTDWMYGGSLDWTGKIIEILTHMTLEEYMQENICKHVGSTEITFWPMKKAGMKDRMVDFNPNDPAGAGLAVAAGVDVHAGTENCFGGQGLYSTGPEFMKILHSLLRNDEKLLKKETVDLMFQPHLVGESERNFKALLASPLGHSNFGGHTPLATNLNYGFGGLLVADKVPNWFGKDTLMWSGGVNSVWFIDRENGLCGFGSPQMTLPVNMAAADELKLNYKREIYRVFAGWKDSII